MLKVKNPIRKDQESDESDSECINQRDKIKIKWEGRIIVRSMKKAEIRESKRIKRT